MMYKPTPEELAEIVKKSRKHWRGEEGGEIADLSGTNLSGADGLFAVAYLGKHQAIAPGGYISIGCERHTYQEWLDNYQEIGKANDYTDSEIARYGAWIKLVTDWLIEAEKEQEAR